MTEQYNFEESGGGKDLFNHLMLDGEVRELTKRDDFDPSNLTVDLKINGVQVKIGDFNEVLEDWSNRIKSRMKDKLEYMSKEKTVVDKAELLLREKLGKVYEGLNDIEGILWKLGE